MIVQRFITLISASAIIGWTGTAAAAKTNPEAVVVAKLYKDFAWQAMADQPDLFGADISHLDKRALEQYFAPALAKLLAPGKVSVVFMKPNQSKENEHRFQDPAHRRRLEDC